MLVYYFLEISAKHYQSFRALLLPMICQKCTIVDKYVSEFKKDPSTTIFSTQFLDIGNSEVELHLNTNCIKLPDHFCTLIQTKLELIDKVFPNIYKNYLDHNWLHNRKKRWC